ncbi:hypothetical protein TspCOW1_01250 [Thiohalobacter sp. COW1]|nr:hypothetical protein [Thiohalobacter sp. COW1]BCO30022.1 hypothetical protein TspCOW1_01250 [Thiohalobacter sp. COW1]
MMAAMKVIKPATRALGAVAVYRGQERHAAELAHSFVPCLHGDETRHENGTGQVELWFSYEPGIRLVYIDDDARGAPLCLNQALVQPPDESGLQHAHIAFPVPGIGEWCLARGGGRATQLTVQTVGRGFFQLCQLADEPCTRTELNQSYGLHDSRGVNAKFDIAASAIDSSATRRRDRRGQC